MRTNGFRLAVLERLRTLQLHEAGQALAQANDALASALARRGALTRALAEAGAHRHADPADAVQASHHRGRLRAERALAAAAVDELAHRLALARQAWLDARTALRAVEALHDRHRQAARREQDRREQRAVDELAGNQAAHRTLRDPERHPDGGAA